MVGISGVREVVGPIEVVSGQGKIRTGISSDRPIEAEGSVQFRSTSGIRQNGSTPENRKTLSLI